MAGRPARPTHSSRSGPRFPGNKAARLGEGGWARPDDCVLPEEDKDPFVLKFLALKDEYSEVDLEEALIRHLEILILELGGDFCFIGWRRRLRIGDDWCPVDLLFYRRRLQCVVVIDLKIGRFKYADAGQMRLYLNVGERQNRVSRRPPRPARRRSEELT